MKDSFTVIVIALLIAVAIVILSLAVSSFFRRRERKFILKILEQSRTRVNEPGDLRESIKNTPDSFVAPETETPQKSEILRLLRENSTENRRLAISRIRKYRMFSLSEELCNCLNIPALEADATGVLEEFGERSVHGLINFCSRSYGNIAAYRSAIRLLGKACNRESSSFLFTRLEDESREVREEAARSLAGSDFFVSAGEKSRLVTLVEDVADCIAWDLSAKATLTRYNDSFLLGPVERDIRRWKEFLFRLLSIAYGQGTIDMIKGKTEEGSKQSVALAGKLIYSLVDPAVREKVFLVALPMNEKIRMRLLGKLYPQYSLTYDELAEAIINRDYNQLDLWIKACTLRRLPEIRTPAMRESVSALLFSHEDIMREEAVRLMARTNRELYWSVSERIADPFRRRLDRIVMGTIEKEDLLYDKVTFLSEKFDGIPKHEIISLSGHMVYAPELGSAPGENCIIWPLRNNGSEVFIHNSQASNSGFLPSSDEPCYILSLSTLEEFRIHYPDRSGVIDSYFGKYAELKEC